MLKRPLVPIIAIAVSAVAIALSLVAIFGSSGDEPQAQGVCVDPKTQARVDDSRCGSGDGSSDNAFLWYWIGLQAGQHAWTVPAVGQPVYGGSYTRPTVPAVRGGAPATGGVVKPATVKGPIVKPPAAPAPAVKAPPPGVKVQAPAPAVRPAPKVGK